MEKVFPSMSTQRVAFSLPSAAGAVSSPAHATAPQGAPAPAEEHRNEAMRDSQHVTHALDTAISIRGVSKKFAGVGEAARLTALEDVNLDICRNEFVSLLGPSGCGKTTLLNIMGGLLHPSSGEVMVNGRRIAGPLPRDIAFVFQENTLLPWYTILRNLHVALEFAGVPKALRGERAHTALAAVGMAEFGDHYPHQLSVGMKQRVALARGLSLQTDIILMDEPFAALDEQTRMVLGEDLSGLLERSSKTIVFVTHSLAEAVYLSDRIFVFTARPARIKSIVTVAEPHPRRPEFMTCDKFNELRTRLYVLLREEIRRTAQGHG
ncbi:MAG: ABC transporter ATP-binding protein [Steroidobacteraceae bacterium]